MSGHPFAATQLECPLCDGPCRNPFHLPPIHRSYPFMTSEQIEATHPVVDQPPAPERQGRRSRRPGENTARRPSEDRARRPEEDR